MTVTPSVSGYCHEHADVSQVIDIFPGKLKHFKVTHLASEINALLVNLTSRFSPNFKENNVQNISLTMTLPLFSLNTKLSPLPASGQLQIQ